MSFTDELLENNKRFASGFDAQQGRRGDPRVAVVADGSGRLSRIPLGSARLAGAGQAIVADLSTDVGGLRATTTPPLRLVSLDLGVDPPTDVSVYGSFELRDVWPMRIYWAVAGWARGRTNRNGMRTTLERVKAEVESPA